MVRNATESTAPARAAPRHGLNPGLALGALGVVFGDLGTSPLYTIKTCFTTAHATPTLANVLGILSLLIWTLAFVVCVKYVGVLMRIDHDGEGGILALLGLASPAKSFGVPLQIGWLTIVAVAGASLLFGDGIITPAISVISAIEGLDVATKNAQPFIVPVSVAILVALFLIQSRGTERVGKLFGPVMMAWFLAIGVAGLAAILKAPQILYAIDPRHALWFITHHGIYGFLIFGAIILAMTGVEALYADMSHFSRTPIAFAWYVLVFPTLLLSYLGQGASLMGDPNAFESPFYSLSPGPFLIPMVVLATMATVIASQAVISGVFTLTEQAINLNLWPRMTVLHTSAMQRGQVYVPAVNIALGIACVTLVLTFRSSENLAAAFGLAVSGTMLATSIVFYDVVTKVLNWNQRVAVPVFLSFLVLDLTFFISGLQKIPDGAWVPLVISAAFMITAITWLRGRTSYSKALFALQMPIEQYMHKMQTTTGEPQGTMVFLTGDPHSVPFVGGKHEWIRERAAEERVVVLTLVRAASPYVSESQRVSVNRLSDRLVVVTSQFGYMELPVIDPVLRACETADLFIDNDETSFFYADPKLIRANEHALPDWQRRYYEWLMRSSRPLPDDLGIKADRRVELGVEVAI